MITNEMLLKELAKFFMEEFNNDASGVADWIAQGDYDAEDFINKVKELAK